MEKKDRLTKVFEWLRYEKIISTKKEFAERIKVDKTNLSSAFSGVEKYLTDSLFNKIADNFPEFDRNWLMTGEGEMLKPSVSQTAVGDNNTQVAGNGNNVNVAATTLMEELSAQRKLTEKAQEQVTKSQEQIDRLLSIIEKMK